jgi:predicted regulator of Ras-like GTPase activity (Roadblock/LC7/MglB family)
MSIVADLTKELDALASEQGIEISAVITRSGAPIAWHLPDGTSAETIATLSATIFGASEVIYTGHGWDKPKKVTIEADEQGTLITRSLGTKAILVLMSKNMNRTELDRKAEDAEIKMREVMQNE